MENKIRKVEGNPYNLSKNGGSRKTHVSPRIPYQKSNYDLNKSRKTFGK